ncbi:MAG: hypothetical protein EOP05_09300 [Proteobacteria bacterium]|nr:MAG: hypothetical protein EOP05_09300 [Pseudomonadota bacterium]
MHKPNFAALTLIFSILIATGCAHQSTFDERSERWAKSQPEVTSTPAPTYLQKPAAARKTSNGLPPFATDTSATTRSVEDTSDTVSGSTSPFTREAPKSSGLSILGIIALLLVGFAVVGIVIDRLKSRTANK